MNESAKPIEPGCLCYVLPIYNNIEGHIKNSFVTAIRVIPHEEVEHGDLFKNHPLWVIDNKCDNGLIAALPESVLLRIDDDELQKQIESEKELQNV